MPVLTRRRGVRTLLLVAAGFPLLLAAGAALLTVVIGKEECDHGLLPDPSCTPQPGATGSGVANFAGASGPMQVGIGGAAGDEYDALRHFLPDPSLGPHDPTTAVQLAALVLIKDKGAPTGRPSDAYRDYARVQRRRPSADAHAARVIADAHAYQGAGTITLGAACSTAFGTPIVPGTKARILADGVAAAPADAPAVVRAMIAAGNRINHFAYSYGGAHGDPAPTMSQSNPNPAAVPGAEENGGPGYDCSSATSYVLWGGGLGQSLLAGGVDDSTALESVGDPGPGNWVTIYATAGHAYIEVAGIYFDTAAGLGNPPNPPATGPRWSTVGTGPAGFVANPARPGGAVATARAGSTKTPFRSMPRFLRTMSPLLLRGRRRQVTRTPRRGWGLDLVRSWPPRRPARAALHRRMPTERAARRAGDAARRVRVRPARHEPVGPPDRHDYDGPECSP